MPATKPLMQCGHAANATCDGKPVCVICFGIKPGATEPKEGEPDLQHRIAYCCYCAKWEPSDLRLPFFEHIPAKDHDEYYCGCRGVD